MTTDPTQPDTVITSPKPNEQLAIQVANALANAGLIKDSHRDELLSKLKSGGVSQDDWNLWIDLATAPKTATDGDDDE